MDQLEILQRRLEREKAARKQADDVKAKLTDGSHINVFDSTLEAEVAQRLDLDAALRRALDFANVE